jgi:hypothetical protein
VNPITGQRKEFETTVEGPEMTMGEGEGGREIVCVV